MVSENQIVAIWIPGCDMTFRRIITVEESVDGETPETVDIVMAEDSDSDSDHDDSTLASDHMGTTTFPVINARQIVSLPPPQKFRQLAAKPKRRDLKRDRDAGFEVDLHLENIRNVRIQTISRGYTKKFPALFAYFEEGGVPEPAFCWGFRTKEVSWHFTCHKHSASNSRIIYIYTPGYNIYVGRKLSYYRLRRRRE
jgi:hypothetical protein